MDDLLGRDDEGTTNAIAQGPPAAEPATPPVPPTPPPDPTDEAAMVEYQRQLQEYSAVMDMYSKILQAEQDTRKSIIDNLRP